MDIKPFTREEIRPCDVCGKPIGVQVFRVTVEAYALNAHSRFTIPMGSASVVMCSECAIDNVGVAVAYGKME